MKYWLGWGPGSLPIHHRPLPLGTFTPGPPPAGIFIARTNFSPTRNPPRVCGVVCARRNVRVARPAKHRSSPTPLPPPRTRNFCAIAHEHDGVSGPAQCGHDATRGEAKASSAGWSTHCHTRTQSHTPRVRTPPRPRTIGNARSRSRSRKGGERARPGKYWWGGGPGSLPIHHRPLCKRVLPPAFWRGF